MLPSRSTVFLAENGGSLPTSPVMIVQVCSRPKLRPNQQDEIVTMVSAGTKTAADAAGLFNVHPATISRLLAKAGAGAIGAER
jgi:hypothetical protein